MTCPACTRQIGLPPEWHAHARLSAPGSMGTRAYAAKTNQKLYLCADCGTVLVKGRNTGWAQALLATASPVT